MLGAPTLENITDRLCEIDLKEWGPDDVRYVCVLFWNHLGYRQLKNAFEVRDWVRWALSSGNFWDLFLSGCHMYDPDLPYGSESIALASYAEPGYTEYFFWNQEQSDLLAEEVARRAAEAGSLKTWSFCGPIELVAVGARRSSDGEIDIDWAGLRGGPIEVNDLPVAISSYTEAHVTLDSDDVPPAFPQPGDFEDDVWKNLKKQLLHAVPGLAKAVVKAHQLL